MLVCEKRRREGSGNWNLDNYKHRKEAVRNCNDYRPAEGKKNLSPSCLWCKHSDVEYNAAYEE